jgi:hypothetical protein
VVEEEAKVVVKRGERKIGKRDDFFLTSWYGQVLVHHFHVIFVKFG